MSNIISELRVFRMIINNVAPLSIEKVNKSYSYDKIVLDQVSLNVEHGEVFGLIGLNGVGKTTLIKAIVGLHKYEDGKISIFGKDSKSHAVRKDIIYLPEKFQPSNFLKGSEFLKIALGMEETSYDQSIANDCAHKIGFDSSFLNKRVSSYSKGMGQKLGLILVLMSKAKLLILDEPMSGLDPSARVALKNQLRKLKEMGKTIFFSSHILDDIDELCDKISVLHNSKIIYIGDVLSFKNKFNQQTDESNRVNSLERAFLSSIAVS